MTTEIGDVSWNDQLEKYFVTTGEQAHGLSLLHKKSEALYSHRKNFVELPVIVGSGIIGFLNAGSSSMFQDAKISSVILGVGSLAVGVLQTVNTYFGWARRAEGHRISSIQYSKLYRFLSIEMALPRDERQTPSQLLKFVKDTIDRLQETSPLLPDVVIADFKKRYEKITDVSRPEETNGLEKITVFQENPMRRSVSDTLMSPRIQIPEVQQRPDV